MKTLFLRIVLSNKMPFNNLKELEINSVVPSIIPRTRNDKPNESVIKIGMIVIPTVVEIANKKFIIRILVALVGMNKY